MSRQLDLAGCVFVVLVALAAVLVPLAVLAAPENSPFNVPGYLVQLFGKYLCYAILAVALDLVWGYCGILSLGHGAFFALGGYAMGMYLMRQIGTRGVYANPVLPDFMVFLNWHELPIAWWGFNSFAYAMLMVVLVPGLLALAFGWFAFRSRVTGVYLSIITQAMTFALYKEFFRNDFGFGGNNGLTDFKDILGFPLQSDAVKAGLFSVTAVFLIASYLVVARDRALQIRQGADRGARLREPDALPRLSRREHTSCSPSSSRRSWRGSAARSMCRRSASSTPANSRPATRSRRRSGSRSAAAARWSARRSAPSRSISPRPISPARCRNTGCSRSGSLFVGVTLFFPQGIMGVFSRFTGRSAPPSPEPRRVGDGGGDMSEDNPKLTASLLYLDDVRVTFDGYRALRGLSLVLAPGEMRAIIGPNGAGKTTMMDVITGKTRPDTGEVYFEGRHNLDQARRGRHRDARHRPQVPEADGVREPHRQRQHAARRQGAAHACARRSRRAPRRKSNETIDRILERIRLTDVRERQAGSLSHGQKQWLEIGMLLAQDPKLLLVDEPVAGMTDAETAATASMLKEIAKEHSVVVVEHDMAFVRELDVKVTVLHEGAVLAEGTLDQVSADERVVEVYLGR